MAKKENLGTKAKIRAAKEKERRLFTTAFLAVTLLLSALSAYFIYTLLNPSGDQSPIQPSAQFKPRNPISGLRAALVDHLNATSPNPIFVQSVADILTEAGYTVDYYDSEKVTIAFYRNLPTYGYGLVVLRVHSGFVEGGGNFTFLFSSEPYSTQKYVKEQLTDQLMIVRLQLGGPTYFGIDEEFVRLNMKGKFSKTLIVMMGCNGLTLSNMAQAFVEKGAKAYISWNAAVSSSHTDLATERLVQFLIQAKLEIARAVETTMKEVGEDPCYRSQLTYYPLDAGNQTVND
jgi:hypothetical protein